MYVNRNTEKRSCKSLLQWKSNKYYTVRVCVCSLTYPAGKAYTPYCYLWPVRLR